MSAAYAARGGQFLTDAQMRKAMHQMGLTARGKARKPKAQRRRAPTPASAMAFRKVAGEKKGMDTLCNLGTIVETTNSAVDMICLNLIQSGSGSFNRVGRKVFLKSVRLRIPIRVQFDTAVTTGNVRCDFVRCVVIWDKQPSGALPIWSDVFKYTPQSGTEVSTVSSPPAYDNMNRFQILRDMFIPVTPAAANTIGGTENEWETALCVDEYIKLGNRQVIYGADTSPAVITDISSGGFYLALRHVANTEASAATIVTVDDVNAIARLRYSD